MPLPDTSTTATPAMGLLLTGGGARAAYQVGVLEAIADLRRACAVDKSINPFPIITGTSAGAINAAALACGADDFDRAVRNMTRVWYHFEAGQVYGADSLSVLRSGARWLSLLSIGWALARWRRMRPQSLLDNSPLQALLHKAVALQRLPSLLHRGHLKALAVTASSYTSGTHMTFFESGGAVPAWVRSQRRSMQCSITHEHLLASSAIPFVFPAKGLMVGDHLEYFGDGSMRQSAPIAPAIHLGAQRIVVIGAGRMHEPKHHAEVPPPASYPTLAQIAGHALSNIFLDALSVDVERVLRVNQTLNLIPASVAAQSPLRPIDLLVISPSQRIDAIAAKHIGDLPVPVRTMLGALGVTSSASDAKGAALASYLLFEASYTRELMALGRSDTLARRGEICRFFGWTDTGLPLRSRTPPKMS